MFIGSVLIRWQRRAVWYRLYDRVMASTSETSVNLYKTARHCNPIDSHIHTRHRENFKSNCFIVRSTEQTSRFCRGKFDLPCRAWRLSCDETPPLDPILAHVNHNHNLKRFVTKSLRWPEFSLTFTFSDCCFVFITPIVRVTFLTSLISLDLFFLKYLVQSINSKAPHWVVFLISMLFSPS
jgi:hypothetical protein